MMPSSDVLIVLSNALGMKLDYFFRSFTIDIDPSEFEFRKKSSMGSKKVESIKFLVCSEIEKYLEIEAILGITISLLALTHFDVMLKDLFRLVTAD